jgi:hypothetical protein
MELKRLGVEFFDDLAERSIDRPVLLVFLRQFG